MTPENVPEKTKNTNPQAFCYKKNNFCRKCSAIIVLLDGYYVCSSCGKQWRATSHSVLAFNNMRDYSSVYTREYRFRNLLRDLNGAADMPDICVKTVLDESLKIKTCEDARKLLKSNTIFRKYQNQVSTVMQLCGFHVPLLQIPESKRCVLLFTMIDMKIGQLCKINVAFTYILPQILRLIGRTEWEDGGYLKKISPLLEKKYGEPTRTAIRELNLYRSRGENIT